MHGDDYKKCLIEFKVYKGRGMEGKDSWNTSRDSTNEKSIEEFLHRLIISFISFSYGP